MIELPLDNTPSKEFSVNTPVGVLRFRTQWDSFLGQWYMDILSPTGETWLNRVALTAGVDNLLAGCGIPELRDCALFAIDTKDVGVRANATVMVNSTISNFYNTVKYDSNGTSIWGSRAHDGWSSSIAIMDGDLVCMSSDIYSSVTAISNSGTFKWKTDLSTTDSAKCVEVSTDGTILYTFGLTSGRTGFNINKISLTGELSGGFLVDRPSGSPQDLAVDNSGNVYTCGNGTHQINKYNSSGVLQWSYDWSDDASSIAVDGSGNVYAAVINWIGSLRSKLLKINSSGALVWQKDSTGLISRVRVAPNGNIYAIGNKDLSNNHVNVYNSSGDIQWNASMSSATNMYRIAFDGSSNAYICGTADNEGKRIFSYNSSGSLRWSINPLSTIGALAVTSDGGVIVSGAYIEYDKKLRIGNISYSFKNLSVSMPYDILIGNSDYITMQRLVSAINGTGQAGVFYGSGTSPHPLVRASMITSASQPTMLICAVNPGLDGSKIGISQPLFSLYDYNSFSQSSPSLEYGNDHGGNHKLDLFNDIGKTYRVFMSFPGDTVINPFTTTF